MFRAQRKEGVSAKRGEGRFARGLCVLRRFCGVSFREIDMGLLDAVRVTANVGGKEIILETGRVARQAHGAVWIQCEGTVALVTVCEQPLETPRDFFPLTVEYGERCTPPGVFRATFPARNRPPQRS